MKKNLLSVATIFLGSCLVFGVQPMVGRTLLPVFGGTAAVWVVCLCAFQLLLLAGYFHAHRLSRATRRHLRIHLGLLLLAAVWVVVVALKRGAWLALAGGNAAPAIQVLVCVIALVGVPYVLLSANSSLVQALSGGDYRLYAVSNAGSLMGLLAYPFLLEPYVGLTVQWAGFGAGIALYTVLLGYLAMCRNAASAVQMVDEHVLADASTRVVDHAPRVWTPLIWAALPALSCFLLNALTTHVTLDVMPMPLIWTGSLALFLVSYIVGFSGIAACLVRPLAGVTIILLIAVGALHGVPIAKVGMPLTLVLYGGLLLAACSCLHAGLYMLRPDARGLTRYYLLQSIGGALGGTVASLVFPLVATRVTEYPVALVLTGLSVAGLCAVHVRARRWACGVAMAGMCLATVLWGIGARKETRPAVYRGRGFFGTIEVLEAKARAAKGAGVIHEFVHGSTIHGIQALVPGRERMPTTYYTPNASGYAIVAHPKYRTGEPMRVNITGLGVGVLFSYGRTNDYYRAYEISPDALAVATDTNLFTFVSGFPGEKEIVLGDARKGLEAELAAAVEPYDVIVVDAFTGDNLPYHLSTVEAFDLYFKLLKPDGILCVNISNWHLSLEPFMRTIGEHYGVPLLGMKTADYYPALQFGAKVAFFCRKPEGMADPPFGRNPNQALPIDFTKYRVMPRLPTDEKGSFVDLIAW